MIFSIPHNRPSINESDRIAILSPLLSGYLSNSDQVKKFESEFAAYMELPAECAVAVSSGTAALYLALWALGVSGKDVCFPAYTCSSLSNAVAMIGAKKKLCDISPGTPNIDISLIPDGSIAIIPHMYGIPGVIPSSRSIKVIEDVSQSLGASLNGIPLGLHGDIGIFSFYATKMITSGGQGGMLISKDVNLISEIKDYINFDCRTDKKNRFNFQMTEIQAAMGRSQLTRLPGFIERREHIFQYYKSLGLLTMQGSYDVDKARPVRYRTVILVDNQKILIDKLKERKITAINPLEPWELLGSESNFPNSSKLTSLTVSLPCYPTLTDLELKYIGDTIIRLID